MADLRRTRLSDVAALAGVSTMTVQRVLHDPEKVATATRERVQDVLRQTSYIPDLTARGLAARKTKLVAAIVPLLANAQSSETLQGLTDVLTHQDFQLLVGVSRFNVEEEETLISRFLSRGADAFFLTGTSHTAAAVEMLKQHGVPVVEGVNLTEQPIDILVGYSHFRAAREITHHLMSRGYSSLGYIGPLESSNERARDRHLGFEQACLDENITISPQLCKTTELSMEAGARAMATLLSQSPRPRAVFCATDILAAGAIFECQRQRIDIPSQIAVAGFDDLEIARQIVPSLTTVRVPRYEIGRLAAEAIVARLSDKPATSITDVGFELVIRDSS
ncbi:LacI family DNA-binding transcriptional regulator [Paraburkholderia fungorum]|uniref:HTH lacI-type domain-containing protein n=1 Tax=Paraburkholderia fungorum TaxID=134537 RepID=A0A3R7E9W2_9BURK|nr:LacI family DNA-binding transcriptional regulator [Paraburkholderia fungorum]RKF50118.1 hypothetical protein BCY88_15265 [Paraburkholderia fungorum]